MRELPFRRVMAATLFILALLAWITEFAYIIAAWKNTQLPVSWGIFGVFYALILMFLVPALILSIPKDPLNPRRVFIISWLIFIFTFWSFGFLYTYMVTYVTDRFAFLMLIVNHSWESPVFPFVYSLFMYRYFRKLVHSAQPSAHSLFYFPIWLGFGFVVLMIFAGVVGTTMAWLTFHVPLYELLKTVITLAIIALMGGLLCFFMISHIIRPWLEKPASSRAPKI